MQGSRPVLGFFFSLFLQARQDTLSHSESCERPSVGSLPCDPVEETLWLATGSNSLARLPAWHRGLTMGPWDNPLCISLWSSLGHLVNQMPCGTGEVEGCTVSEEEKHMGMGIHTGPGPGMDMRKALQSRGGETVLSGGDLGT